MGRVADQHGAPDRRAVRGRSRTRTGRSCRKAATAAAGRSGCGSFDKHYQCLGDSGGAGVGYGAPAAVGAALANKKHGRLSVNIQGDGDFLYAPGVWWTAAHHRIPLLTVMHNNRAYHQEVMHLQRMASRHQRGITRAHIGTTIDDPNVDFAKIAQGMGVHGGGTDHAIPTISARRSRARSPSSSRASRRSSTSSRSRGSSVRLKAEGHGSRSCGFRLQPKHGVSDAADSTRRLRARGGTAAAGGARADGAGARAGMRTPGRSCSSATAVTSATATRDKGRAPPDRGSPHARCRLPRSRGTSGGQPARCRSTRRRSCRTPTWPTSTLTCSLGRCRVRWTHPATEVEA